MQTVIQFLMTIMTYALMGTILGVGVVIVQKYQPIWEFLTLRPILGWTLAFAIGSVVLTLTLAALETVLLVVLNSFLR